MDGLSPDLLEADARVLFDQMKAAGLDPIVNEVRFANGTVYCSIEEYPGYATGPNGELMIPVQYLWNLMLPETRAQVLKVGFGGELTPGQVAAISRKTWYSIKPEGRPRLWRALRSFMRDECATVEGL